MAGGESEQALRLIRALRHSYLNHLQVVLGWLQMDRADRARAHVERMAEAMTAESNLLQRLPGALVLAALELGLAAEQEGVHLHWQVEGEPAEPDEAAREGALAAVRAEVLRAARRPEAERSVLVRVGRDGALTIESPRST